MLCLGRNKLSPCPYEMDRWSKIGQQTEVNNQGFEMALIDAMLNDSFIDRPSATEDTGDNLLLVLLSEVGKYASIFSSSPLGGLSSLQRLVVLVDDIQIPNPTSCFIFPLFFFCIWILTTD